MAKHDGSPVQDSQQPLQISSTYDSVEFKNFTKMLDENGMAELEFYPPNNASESLKIEVILIFIFNIWYSIVQIKLSSMEI